MYVLFTQSCLTLCDPMDCNPPGSLVHGILFSRGSSQPREREAWLGSKNGSCSCVQICEGQFLRTRSSPVWLVVLRAEHGCVEGSYRGAGLAHQQEELSVKWNPAPAETRSFQVCPSSLGNWVRMLGRKAEKVSPPPGRGGSR